MKQETLITKQDILRGLGTALITPFTSDGAIDFDALGRLIDHQLNGSVDYLVVLGTTGEAATLTREEKDSVIGYVVERVADRLPLVLGLGGNCTRQVVEDLDYLHDTLTQSFAAVLSVCPYYNKPTQEGLFQHFNAIAAASPISVLLYNVPGRTGVNMLPETAVRIVQANPGKVIGIKEASGNVEQIRELITLAAGQMLVISGDDGIACELMNEGADGLISVASNAWPEVFGKIVHQRDMALQQQYAHLVHLLFVEGNPCGIKTVLHQIGLIDNQVRLPLVINSPEVQDIIRRAIEIL